MTASASRPAADLHRGARWARMMDPLLGVGLFALALALRFMTARLFGASVSTDEYRYALIADEWVRLVRGESQLSWDEMVIYHPLVPWLAGVAELATGAGALLVGRVLQLAFNASLAPLTFILGRRLGLARETALVAGLLMAVIPGAWEIAVPFWPDSQMAALSTVTLIGLVLCVQRHPMGVPLSVLGLATAFLSKEHLFLLLLPAAAIMLGMATLEGRLRARVAILVLLAMAAGLLAAVGASIAAPSLPRAAVIWLLLGRPATTPLEDGLPSTAQVVEEASALSWASSALSAVLEGRVQLQRMGDGLSLRVWGAMLATAGLAGTTSMLIRLVRHARQLANIQPRPALLHTAATTLSAILVALLAVIFAWQLLVGEPMIGAAWCLTGIVIGSAAALKDPKLPVPRWAIGGLTAYVIGTVAFFLLGHDLLQFLTRFLLPTFPIVAVFMALGLRDLTRLMAVLVRQAPVWLVVLGCGVALALSISGGYLRRGGIVVLAGVAAALAHQRRRALGKVVPALLAMTLAGVVILAGTPTLNTLQRGRDFKGYPDDPLYRTAAGALRVATFERAEPWLREHVRAEHIVLTSKPYQVAWYSSLGFSGFKVARVWDELALQRRPYLRDDLLATGAYDWIIDFNQYAIQPQSPEGPAFLEDFRWLQGRPYLELAYELRDAEDRLLLYALRHTR